jgi:hypothetical protein
MGLRAKLIGEALQVPFTSCGDSLLTNRAVTCQVPNDRPGTHRTLIEQIYREGFRDKPSPAGVSNAGRNR